MRSKPIWRQSYILPTLVMIALVIIVAIIVAAINQNEEQIAASGSTPEAKVEATTQPDTSPIVPEPTAEEPTAEPTREATSEIQPSPTEDLMTAFAVMEEHVSVTEFFSLMVPAGWSSEETFPGGAFVMATSEAALERFSNGGAIESGDLVLNLGFLPFELFRQREIVPLNIQFEATPDVFMQSVLPVFRVLGDAVPGNVELVSLSDERDAGMMTVTDEGREGLILMYIVGDEVVAVVSAIGFPGEVDAFQETMFAVASSVTFSGAQGALYGTLLEG